MATAGCKLRSGLLYRDEILRRMALFDLEKRGLLPLIGQVPRISNARTSSEMGWTPSHPKLPCVQVPNGWGCGRSLALPA